MDAPKTAPKTSAPQPKRWKFAKGKGADIPGPNGMLKLREQHLSNPAIIEAVSHIEKVTGNKIFGVVLIEA